MLRNSLSPQAYQSLQRAKVERLKRLADIGGESPDVITWIESNFYITETRAPIVLVDYQKAVIREALSKDENGLFRYSMVLYSDLKKSAKSVIAGAVALYLAWHTPYETVRIIGNDLKQADSRTFTYIKNAIELNPDLSPQCKVVQYRIELPNKTVIQAVAVDPKGEAGGGDLMTCFTELWAYKNEASKKMWVETALSPLKFGKSIRWGETYAGYDGESPVLEQLYDEGVTHGTPVDVGIAGLELTRNKRMLALWNTHARCSWQSKEYYAHEATQYPPAEYSRIHENKWARSTDAFVAIEQWEACKQKYPDMPQWLPMAIGIDAAVKRDTFSMVGVSRIFNGERHISYVRFCRVWKAPPNGEINFNEPFDELRRICQENNVEGAAYDPYQMSFFASKVKDEGFVHMFEFLQGTPRLESDMHLWDAIRERTIIHNGNDELTQHIQNANKELQGERKLRIVKRRADDPIDAAVALSMAHKYASDLMLG